MAQKDLKFASEALKLLYTVAASNTPGILWIGKLLPLAQTCALSHHTTQAKRFILNQHFTFAWQSDGETLTPLPNIASGGVLYENS